MTDHEQDRDQQNFSAESPIIPEPPVSAEDTSPTGVYRRDATQPVKTVRNAGTPNSTNRRLLNGIFYGVAALLTVIAAVLYIQQGQQSTVSTAVGQTPSTVSATATSGTEIIDATVIPPTDAPTALPTNLPAPSTNTQQVQAQLVDKGVPSDAIAELLNQSGIDVPATDQIYRLQTAYTVAPARSRSTPVQYVIHSGDTLESIAKQFGIAPETIIGSNDGIYVNRLLPGDSLTILPVNGVYYKTNGQETLQQIADKYKVSVYTVIDSEFNQLQNVPPSTLLPQDLQIMLPGAVSGVKASYWDPGIKVTTNTGPGIPKGAAGVAVEFGGGAGSCGALASAGGTGSLAVPLPLGQYQITRGFSAIHSGIDLAIREGTPVFASDRGTVIFAGWSTWGYGNAIVLHHGDKLTLYGHLSQINVGCGQVVDKGKVIGAVGSTGNSTAPHLHFEVRPLPANVPVNPYGYLGF